VSGKRRCLSLTVLPRRPKRDIEDVLEELRKQLTFVLV
jgi:hypothetical protein